MPFSTSVELETDNVCLSVCSSQNFGTRQNPVNPAF